MFVWKPLQRTARANAELVFAMDQAQTDVMTQPGPWGASLTAGGFCLGLSATWIAYGFDDRRFPVVDRVCENPPWKATMAQTLAVDSTNPRSDIYSFWRVAARIFRMGLSDGLRAERDVPFNGELATAMLGRAFGFYGATLGGADGSHAIALRHSRDNRVHLFDANFGHFRLGNIRRLQPFLNWYMAASGYDRSFGEWVGMVGITPPQR